MPTAWEEMQITTTKSTLATNNSEHPDVARILGAIGEVSDHVTDLRMLVRDTQIRVSEIRDQLDRIWNKVEEMDRLKAARTELEAAEGRLKENFTGLAHSIGLVDGRLDHVEKQTGKISNVEKQLQEIAYVVERHERLRWQFLAVIGAATAIGGPLAWFLLGGHNLIPWK